MYYREEGKSLVVLLALRDVVGEEHQRRREIEDAFKHYLELDPSHNKAQAGMNAAEVMMESK